MKKIFVKSVNWVGDAVLVTPALRALRRAFPEASITLLARPSVAPVFEANPDVDRLWTADERGSLRRFRHIARRLRTERFDLGLILPNSFHSALLPAVGRVKKRVGYNRDGRRLLLTHPVEPTPEILGRHEVDYYMNLLSEYCDADAQPRELVVQPAPGTDRLVQNALEKQGLTEAEIRERPLAAICPGAAFGTAKRWLPDRYAAVADRLTEKWGARVVVVGSPAEREVAEEIARMTQHPITVLSGAMPLRASIALMDRLRVFVTNDCGAMHLAAARNVPIVAIFGPTKPENTAPYHPRAVIVRRENVGCPDHPCMTRHCTRDHVCMKGVSVEEVNREVDKQMADAPEKDFSDIE